MLERHPCYSAGAAKMYGRMHLPVAPKCNLKCRYCDRRYDCANECRPGVSSRVMSPREALVYAAEVVRRDPRITVAGFAGPGDPLANEATFETLELLRDNLPALILCLSTNGLALSQRVGQLVELGVKTITVTLNAVHPRVGAQIYSFVRLGKEIFRGEEAAAVLLERQIAGIREAVDAGMVLKVNSVLIPGINDRHLPAVARVAGRLGATLFNVMPIIPQADFANIPSPDDADLMDVRKACGDRVAHMLHCKQCRADAVGLLGEKASFAENGCADRRDIG